MAVRSLLLGRFFVQTGVVFRSPEAGDNHWMTELFQQSLVRLLRNADGSLRFRPTGFCTERDGCRRRNLKTQGTTLPAVQKRIGISCRNNQLPLELVGKVQCLRSRTHGNRPAQASKQSRTLCNRKTTGKHL